MSLLDSSHDNDQKTWCGTPGHALSQEVGEKVYSICLHVLLIQMIGCDHWDKQASCFSFPNTKCFSTQQRLVLISKNVKIQNCNKDIEVNTPSLFTWFDYFDCIHLSLQLKASLANLIKLTGSFTEVTSQCLQIACLQRNSLGFISCIVSATDMESKV